MSADGNLRVETRAGKVIFEVQSVTSGGAYYFRRYDISYSGSGDKAVASDAALEAYRSHDGAVIKGDWPSPATRTTKIALARKLAKHRAANMDLRLLQEIVAEIEYESLMTLPLKELANMASETLSADERSCAK